MEHSALITVIQAMDEGSLDHHLTQSHIAGLQGDVGDTVDGHARRHFHPQTGIAWDREKTRLTDPMYAASWAEAIDEDSCAVRSTAHGCFDGQRRFGVGGDNTACSGCRGLDLRTGDEGAAADAPPLASKPAKRFMARILPEAEWAQTPCACVAETSRYLRPICISTDELSRGVRPNEDSSATELNAEQALGLVSYGLMQRLAGEGHVELPWLPSQRRQIPDPASAAATPDSHPRVSNRSSPEHS